ncbi:MAG: sulfurtransferase complex subunit TusB [Sulfitobacter sp.]|uniref:sulfurtransferase complex subunit TusB n=1 Tax=Antarcticimicrobium sp. TaxID=2824147 RepID=UPI002632C986|nr:sulfurtransferase complex subunit TusB [Antarcticimicrobium sp.]MDF1717910.1 sulfurtransferase complex subunit TusB [Antarcticimicrobium sp.]MDF1729715.1 sulfurtransferase complex subunit TusB [Sulfitobacter sp.]
MSTLHTVNKSPFTNGALLSCLKHCKPGDAVLLIEDGVYGALAGSSVAGAVSDSLEDVTLYVLGGDASARGLDDGKVLSGAKTVGYDGFVDLVVDHARTQAWL